MYDLVCLSHLRWDFVFQRPQHLLSRAAQRHQVLFFEEPVFEGSEARLAVSEVLPGLSALTPVLPSESSASEALEGTRDLLERALEERGIEQPVLWFYTPMAVPVARGLAPRCVVYDCMDELSAFKGAPKELRFRERELFEMADLVFTGGHALYEAKLRQHDNVHAFPSSVDIAHFARARTVTITPRDQLAIPEPRLGFAGVIDERMDLSLLAAVADLRPQYQFVLLGPVVKIDPEDIPKRPNIHHLGPKPYAELPAYIAGWNVALMPFARNEATRFISPTKTPEYLAAGKPVVSTSIRDVVRTYESRDLVDIADDPISFARACDRALSGTRASERRSRADAFLKNMSWDDTWMRMERLLDEALSARARRSAPSLRAARRPSPILDAAGNE